MQRSAMMAVHLTMLPCGPSAPEAWPPATRQEMGACAPKGAAAEELRAGR